MERSVTYAAPRNPDPLRQADAFSRVVAGIGETLAGRQGWREIFPEGFVTAQYNEHRDAIGLVVWGVGTGALFFSVALAAWVAWVVL
jgi:hypothetical protein